jgi:hypothetical protein
VKVVALVEIYYQLVEVCAVCCNVKETRVDGYGAMFLIMAGQRFMTSSDSDAQTRPQWMIDCDTDAVIIEERHIKPGLLNLLHGGDNFKRIWSTCRQHEIQYTE